MRANTEIDLGNKTVTQTPSGWNVAVQFEALAKDWSVVSTAMHDTLILSDNRRVAASAKKVAKRIRRSDRERDGRRKGSVNRRARLPD